MVAAPFRVEMGCDGIEGGDGGTVSSTCTEPRRTSKRKGERWTEIKFLQRFGMQRVSRKIKVQVGEDNSKELMCEIGKPEPSPRITSSVPSYLNELTD